MNRNYVEIDLIDFFISIFKKWKLIVICALIVALLGGLYSLYQMKKTKPSDEKTIKALTAEMTQEEIDQVEDAARVINDYRALYNKQKEYNENSIYQNLNPYNLNTLVLSYYVDNHYKVSYPVIDESNNLVPIVSAYMEAFNDDSFYADLAKANGLTDSTYIKELITVDKTSNDSGIFSVTVYAESNDMLEKIGSNLKDTIAKKQAEIAETYGSHDITLTDEETSKTVNNNMAEIQKQNIERLTNISTNLIKTEEAFSGNQLSYLKFLIHEKQEEDVSIIKNVVLGVIIGSFLSVAYVAVMYILDGSLKTESEVACTLNTISFGRFDSDVDFLASIINNATDAADCKKIGIVCDECDEKINSLSAAINADTMCVTEVLNSKDSLELLMSCDAAIVVEVLKESKRKDALKIKELCENVGVKLIGVVIK